MSKDNSPLRIKIAEKRQAMIQDSAYADAVKKLGQDAVEKVARDLRESFIGYMNFANFYQALYLEKTHHGGLSTEVEARLARRGEEALEDYRAIKAAAERFGQLSRSSGFAPVIERHLPSVFQHFNHNPNYGAIVDGFRELGVTEIQLSWVIHLLAEEKYNALHCMSEDGTVEGLVRRVQSCVPRVERLAASLRAHGLVVFEGAMPSGNGGGDGGADGGADGGNKPHPQFDDFMKLAGGGTAYGQPAVSAGLLLMMINMLLYSM